MFEIEIFREILRAFWRNRLRTMLTGVSVAWGIFILVVLLGADKAFAMSDTGKGDTRLTKKDIGELFSLGKLKIGKVILKNSGDHRKIESSGVVTQTIEKDYVIILGDQPRFDKVSANGFTILEPIETDHKLRLFQALIHNGDELRKLREIASDVWPEHFSNNIKFPARVRGRAYDSELHWAEEAGLDMSNIDMELELSPNTTAERTWARSFNAIIKNNTSKDVVVAHLGYCWTPEQMAKGKKSVYAWAESEILLKVTKPNGDVVTLRHGMYHGFDPGNKPILRISSGNSESFHIGWFFENARGRWENDREAWKLFSDKGRYKVVLLFRNSRPIALYNSETGPVRIDSIWTGEMKSEEIIVEVK